MSSQPCPRFAFARRSSEEPRITVAGKAIEFLVELKSGSWIECNGPDDCAAYGARGEALGKVTPRGGWPTLPTGVAPAQFSCESSGTLKPRARVTVLTRDRELLIAEVRSPQPGFDRDVSLAAGSTSCTR